MQMGRLQNALCWFDTLRQTRMRIRQSGAINTGIRVRFFNRIPILLCVAAQRVQAM